MSNFLLSCNVNNVLKTFQASTRARKTCHPRDFPRLVRILLWCTGASNHLPCFSELLRNIDLRCAAHGNKFRVQYLKACIALLVAFMNEERARGLSPHPAITRDRLPLVLPVFLRTVFRSLRSAGAGNSVIVLCRLTITILSFYRLLYYKSPVALESITAPGPEMGSDGWSSIKHAITDLSVKSRWKWHYRNSRPKATETAGPNGPRAAWFAGADALAFLASRENRSQARILIRFCILTKQYWIPLWLMMFWVVVGPFTLLYLVIVLFNTPIKRLSFGALWHDATASFPARLGALAVLKEAAGKNRIVAQVDWWTQSALRGLHDSIFRLLRDIPNDGTFNQFRPVETCVLPFLHSGCQSCSYDLSSATDRLPLEIQQIVLSELAGDEFATLWGQLMRRSFWYQGRPIKYAVGQPMGAYSSWAMLALTHHVIVQMAAKRAGWAEDHFSRYAVLGDDLVIADEGVGTSYLSIMAELGVGISMHKSIVSRNGLLEFAKRIHSNLLGDLSPVGPRLLLAAMKNVLLLPSLGFNLLNNGWFTSLDGGVVRLNRAFKQLNPRMGSIVRRAMSAALVNPRNTFTLRNLPYSQAARMFYETYVVGFDGLRATRILNESINDIARKRVVDASRSVFQSWSNLAESPNWVSIRWLGAGRFWYHYLVTIMGPAYWLYLHANISLTFQWYVMLSNWVSGRWTPDLPDLASFDLEHTSEAVKGIDAMIKLTTQAQVYLDAGSWATINGVNLLEVDPLISVQDMLSGLAGSKVRRERQSSVLNEAWALFCRTDPSVRKVISQSRKTRSGLNTHLSSRIVNNSKRSNRPSPASPSNASR